MGLAIIFSVVIYMSIYINKLYKTDYNGTLHEVVTRKPIRKRMVWGIVWLTILPDGILNIVFICYLNQL